MSAVKAAFSMFTMIPLDVEGDEVVGLSKRFYLIVPVGAFYGLIAGSLMWVLSRCSRPWRREFWRCWWCIR